MGVGLAITGLGILYLYRFLGPWLLDKLMLSATHWHWWLALVCAAWMARDAIGKFTLTSNHAASALLIACVCLQVVNQSLLQINLLSAVLLLLTLYGFSGHLIAPAYWRSMVWPTLTGVALLPLEFYLEPYFGYPLRLISASAAAQMLHSMEYDTLTRQSILLVENRASLVDLDCSGINSLWAGTVFYLMLTWLTRLRAGIQWLATGLLLILLLLSANIFRIVVLVVLEQAGLNGLSTIAHTALGALGFALSVGLIWLVSRRLPTHEDASHTFTQKSAIQKSATQKSTEQKTQSPHIKPLHWNWPLLPMLATVLIACTLPIANQPEQLRHYRAIQLPASLTANAIPLNAAEERFFTGGNAQVQKYQLNAGASLVLVSSDNWKNQHNPAHCLQALGYSISDRSVQTTSVTQPAAPINAVTVLKLRREVPQHQSSQGQHQSGISVYWYQSAETMVADPYIRMLDSITRTDRRWTLASMLFPADTSTAAIRQHIDRISQAIAINHSSQSTL